MYWVIFFHCHQIYDQLLLLYFDDMIFLHLYFLKFIISSLIIIIDSLSVSVLKELLVWALIWGRFEFPKRLSLFDLFKWFDSLLLTCQLTVVYILLLDLDKTFLPHCLLDNLNVTTIYFILVKESLSTIKIKLENLRRGSMPWPSIFDWSREKYNNRLNCIHKTIGK